MRKMIKEFVVPARIIFGRGAVEQLLPECSCFGKNGLIVHGASVERNGFLKRILKHKKNLTKIHLWQHRGTEPTLKQLDELRAFAAKKNIEWIAGVGGGSVMDIAKACAGLFHAPLKSISYHNGAKILPSKMPFIAVPTTAGTGSEATFVCVFTNEKTNVKKSFRHISFMAKLVILDPSLIEQCPREVIAYAGMDALTQGIESYFSKKSVFFTDVFAYESVRLVFNNLLPAYKGAGGEVYDKLLIGSYFAGIALCNARLGLVHGLAHPLGALFDQPHGLTCAICLPFVLEYNRPFVVEKYKKLSFLVGGDLVKSIRNIMDEMKILSPFQQEDLNEKVLARIINETLASGSTATNPVTVEKKEVKKIIYRIFGRE